MNEELDSGARMLEVFNAWVKHRNIPPMLWSRHGPVPVVFDLPFIKLGKLFVSPDFVLSIQPVLLTAGLVTLLFLWLRKLASPGMSLLLALTAAFGTMLWPYAYIGLETKQSFLVLLAGYLALANGKIHGWPRLLFFALISGLALTVKSTGIVMWPAFAYLLFVQFRKDWRSRWKELLVSSIVIVVVVAIGAWGRNFFWGPLGGGVANVLPWTIESPLQLFINAIGQFGSPSKGALVFAPILLASICALPRAFREQRDITVFGVLVTAAYLGFMCLIRYGADEVWGPRYMHIAIAPMVLCIGAAWPRFEWRKHSPIILLAIIGVMFSFLGAFYYYGVIGGAMEQAGQNTMEWHNGDPSWNVILFDERIFHVYMKGGSEPVMWTPVHTWVWSPPAGARPWTAINLRDYSPPQSFLLRFWREPKSGIMLTVFRMFLFSLIVGPLLMIWTIVRTVRESSSGHRRSERIGKGGSSPP